MKKVFAFCIAALAIVAVSCQQKGADSGIDWSKVTVDGFYVAGPATGSAEIKPECIMSAGFNEEGKTAREGMYEKYIVLEGGKDFYLAYSDGGKLTYYSANLQEFETPLEEAYNDNPEKVLKGKLIVGTTPVAMTVAKTGLYHIVLDVNKLGDLKEAQILLLDASAFQMIGAFGEAESDPAPASFSNGGVTFTYKNVTLMKDAWFKFRTGKYWKVTLDDAGKVKAEVSLGAGMSQNGGNISVDRSGKYDVTLTFKLAQGGFPNNFKYNTEFKEAVAEFPEKAGIYGDYSGHNWNTDDAEPIWIGAKKGEEGTGVYKGVVTLVNGTGYKVFAAGSWYGGEIGNLDPQGGNLALENEGTFYVEINLKDSPKTISFTPITKVGLIGDAVGGWTDDVLFEYDAEEMAWVGDVSFAGTGAFKIRFNGSWDYNYGGTLESLVFVGDDIPSPAAGEYQVWLDFTDAASMEIYPAN